MDFLTANTHQPALARAHPFFTNIFPGSCRISRFISRLSSVVAAFKMLNYHVIAAGDSFNDTATLTDAHVGFLFRAPENVKKKFAQPARESLSEFMAVGTYEELMKLVKGAMG